MSRGEGFAVMDVSTSVCDDPKFRRLHREDPELVAVAFTSYMATMAESWRTGRRVTIDVAWPAFIAFDRAVVDALIRVGLLDARGFLASKAWRSWYLPAQDRRSKSRARWARYNANRDADTTPPPRGSDADTTTSVPSVRTVRSGPSEPSRQSAASARGKKNDGLTTPPTKEEALLALSEDFKAGKLTEIEYERRRRDVAS